MKKIMAIFMVFVVMVMAGAGVYACIRNDVNNRVVVKPIKDVPNGYIVVSFEHEGFNHVRMITDAYIDAVHGYHTREVSDQLFDYIEYFMTLDFLDRMEVL